MCSRKKLEQREKDAEEFYKSDSDDSDTNTCTLDTTVGRKGHSTNGGPNVTSCGDTVIVVAPPSICNSNSISDVSIPNRDVTVCDSEICVPDSSKTTKVGIGASNSEMTIPDSNTGADIPGRSASICTQEGDTDVGVPSGETKRLSSAVLVNGNDKVESEQSQMAEDSVDLCLHYSESENVDMKGSELVTRSALHDEESNAMDAGNTEQLVLHYSETQDSEPSLPVTGDEPKKQEKTAWWENMQPPSPHSEGVDNTANAILQSLARRSMPGMGDITKLKPRLSAAPDGIIELDEEEPGPAGMVKLVQRFMKHSAVKRPLQKKHTVEVGYVPQSLYLSATQVLHTPRTPCLK
jgi:hypothetical protein